MDTTVGSGSSTLTSLLAELAEVFLKAEEQEDALVAADAANAEVERLRGQVAEAQEVAHQRDLRIKDMARYSEVQAETIRNLQGQVNTARRTFGEAFVGHTVGPNRKNRPKLTPAEVGGIRSMVGNGSKIKHVANVYGVHPSTVSRIARGFYHRGEGS
jgi:hypothetical protein